MTSKFNPWPWGLGLTLATFCLIQFSLVALASSGFEGLDDVEYYRHGIEYGKEIDRQARQQDLGWTISENLRQASSPSQKFPLRIALLDGDQKPLMHASVSIKIGRPATVRDDKTYKLAEVGPGIYASDVVLGPGNWKCNLVAEKGENVVKVEFRREIGRATPSSSRVQQHLGSSSLP